MPYSPDDVRKKLPRAIVAPRPNPRSCDGSVCSKSLKTYDFARIDRLSRENRAARILQNGLLADCVAGASRAMPIRPCCSAFAVGANWRRSAVFVSTLRIPPNVMLRVWSFGQTLRSRIRMGRRMILCRLLLTSGYASEMLIGSQGNSDISPGAIIPG